MLYGKEILANIENIIVKCKILKSVAIGNGSRYHLDGDYMG
jgi:hypothetical protein